MALVLIIFFFCCVKVVDIKEIEVGVVEEEVLVEGAAAAAAVEGPAEMVTGVALIQGTFFSHISF